MFTFEGCSNLSDVCIGLNTTLIDNYAFRNCKSLISIVIPNSVKEIRSGAFYGCLNIEDLTLGTNVEIIENEVFYNCDNLKTIYTYNTCPPEITISTFSDIIYQNAVLYVPKDYKTLYWLHPYWEKFKNINEFEVASNIITIINDLKIGNSDIVDVITIYGNKFSMNRNQVKLLPKGIYVVNGKTILIR